MSYMIKDMPLDEKPREKVKKYGFSNVTDADLISILLRCGTKKKSVKELAIDVLEYIRSVPSINDLRVSSLASFNGIGEVKAITLLSAIEFGKRMSYKVQNKVVKVSNAKEVFDVYKYLFWNETQEKVMTIFLNSKNEVIDNKIVFMGTANESIIHPRDIFKEAIVLNAIKVICIHNHPSGNPYPSLEDKAITERLKEVGKIVGIPLVDHIIFGDEKYYSFLENDEF